LNEDIQCEKLLNSLAKQQKESAVIKNDSPPPKRQRLLGANENNEVIIVEDLSPSKPLSRVYNEKVEAAIPSKVDSNNSTCLQAAAPSNSNVVDSEVTVDYHQPSNNEPDDVICIDDDSDDAASVMSPMKPPSCDVSFVSGNDDKSQCSVSNAQNASASGTALKSLSPADNQSSDVNNDSAAVCINLDDIADSEPCPSSEPATSSHLSTSSSVARRWHSPATASRHRSPRKVARLEKLLQVSVYAVHCLLIE